MSAYCSVGDGRVDVIHSRNVKVRYEPKPTIQIPALLLAELREKARRS